MWEKYFRQFVSFLFPNRYFADDSILDFIEGEQTMEEFYEFERNHGIKIDDEGRWAVVLISSILREMRKTKEDDPKMDMIDYYLEEAMTIFETRKTENIEGVKSFRELLREQRAAKV